MSRRHLTWPKVGRALEMLKANFSQQRVTKLMNVSHSVISREIWRHQEPELYTEKPLSGQSATNIGKNYCQLTNLCLRNRYYSARQPNNDFSSATKVNVSTKTICKRLQKAVLFAKKPENGVQLIPAYKEIRLNRALGHVWWILEKWRQVLFKCERRFSIDINKGLGRVWRPEGARFVDACIAERDQYWEERIMMWGGSPFSNCAHLYVVAGVPMTGARYKREVLKPIVVLYAEKKRKYCIFMNDHARLHR